MKSPAEVDALDSVGALQSGQIVATTAVAELTVGADEVVGGAVDAEAREHLPANVVGAPGVAARVRWCTASVSG
jgi:hypothetical protein